MTSDNEPVFTETAQRFHQQKGTKTLIAGRGHAAQVMEDRSYVSSQVRFKRNETQDIRES